MKTIQIMKDASPELYVTDALGILATRSAGGAEHTTELFQRALTELWDSYGSSDAVQIVDHTTGSKPETLYDWLDRH